jgi:hypothetical protein
MPTRPVAMTSLSRRCLLAGVAASAVAARAVAQGAGAVAPSARRALSKRRLARGRVEEAYCQRRRSSRRPLRNAGSPTLRSSAIRWRCATPRSSISSICVRCRCRCRAVTACRSGSCSPRAMDGIAACCASPPRWRKRWRSLTCTRTSCPHAGTCAGPRLRRRLLSRNADAGRSSGRSSPCARPSGRP